MANYIIPEDALIAAAKFLTDRFYSETRYDGAFSPNEIEAGLDKKPMMKREDYQNLLFDKLIEISKQNPEKLIRDSFNDNSPTTPDRVLRTAIIEVDEAARFHLSGRNSVGLDSLYISPSGVVAYRDAPTYENPSPALVQLKYEGSPEVDLLESGHAATLPKPLKFVDQGTAVPSLSARILNRDDPKIPDRKKKQFKKEGIEKVVELSDLPIVDRGGRIENILVTKKYLPSSQAQHLLQGASNDEEDPNLQDIGKQPLFQLTQDAFCPQYSDGIAPKGSFVFMNHIYSPTELAKLEDVGIIKKIKGLSPQTKPEGPASEGTHLPSGPGRPKE